jgi:ATP-dependent DNA helicase RecQ
MPPVAGGPQGLFEGLAQANSNGGLYIAQRTGLPRQSTSFWFQTNPSISTAKASVFTTATQLTMVDALWRLSDFRICFPKFQLAACFAFPLAQWWHPQDRPDEELRCFVQLSGWIGATQSRNQGTSPQVTPTFSLPAPAKPSMQVADLLPRAHQVLKQTFGFSQFLPVQREVISRVLHRQDTLAVMPTGGGKSLCYQLPAMLSDGLTVVVSPLIALMQDQVRQLRDRGHTCRVPESHGADSEYRAIAERGSQEARSRSSTWRRKRCFDLKRSC